MQDESAEASTSISQLLRESYLAKSAIHNGNDEKSRCDSFNPQSHANSVCLSEESKPQDDLSDLSAFLNQEELDKSVNLAIQEIHRSPRETQQNEAQKSTSNPTDEVNKVLKNVPSKPVPHLVHAPASAEKVHNPEMPKLYQDHIIKATKVCKESSKELIKDHSFSGYEKESKKEFINKAADFIEELSSLFKTHNSKRIRPKACKKHRSKRVSNIGSSEGCISEYANMSETRERHHAPIPAEVAGEVEAPMKEDTNLENQTQLKTLDASSEAVINQPPNFTQKLRSREIHEGSRVQLDCTVLGFPVPDVSWYCEGKKLEHSPDIQIIVDGNVHSLIISEAFQEDTGRYYCIATNTHGKDSTFAEIYIEGGSSSESEEEIGNENVDEFQKLTSETDASGLSSTMSSPCLRQEVHKEECPAESAADQTSAGQQLAENPNNHLQGLDGKPLIAAPVFTKMLQNLSASEGQLVVFECRVKGAPSPKVDWYREGSLIEDSPDFRILQKKPRSMTAPEEICTLVIAEAFSEDSGSFTCTASNKYGTVSSSADLKVRGSEDSSAKAPLTLSSINTSAFKHQHLPSNPGHVSPNTTSPLDKPTKPKLEGVLVNHSEPRASSKVGLRVHFKLPEEDQGHEGSSEKAIVATQQILPDIVQETNAKSLTDAAALSKEPPPVLAKPKLGPVQLQQLQNQVLLEQQQFHTSPKQQFPDDTSMSNVYSSSILQQSTSIASQQFTYSRPKEFLASQPTSIFSSPRSTVLMPNSISERIQSPSNFEESRLSSPPPSFQRRNVYQVDVGFSPSVSPTMKIQNPAAFLSSVLPSLPPTPPPSNYMGLPRSAPVLPFSGLPKKTPKLPQLDLACERNVVMEDLKRKLYVNDEISKQQQQQQQQQQQLQQQEYKISSFEQRLLNEIEFRLQRTPVDESDEDVQHDEIPSGKCIAPVIDKRLKHFRVVEGTSVTFTCKVVGIPIPKVYWFKDGTQISKKNQHFKMKREADGTCSLHIEAASNDDDGNYTIMAANPQGKISCSGHLLVQTASIHLRKSQTVHFHRVRSQLQKQGEQVQDRFFRPYFLQAPGDLVAHEGQLCRLDCKISGLPTPDLLWLLNGRPVLEDETHRLLVKEDGIYSLLIDPLMQEDAGTYTCIATNKAGQNSFTLLLSVVAKEFKQAPVFIEKLQNSGVPEGHSVRLESRVVGMPPPVFYWKKDNETISGNYQRVSMHQDTTGYACLLIHSTRKDDAGWYTLSAKNEAGIVSCTAKLDVYAQWYQQIPQPIKIRGQSSGSRYTTIMGQGLDIPSPSVENMMAFSSASWDVVESEEL